MIDVFEVDFPDGAATLQEAIDAYGVAVSAHPKTVNVPAPAAPAVVKLAYEAGGFVWRGTDPIPPTSPALAKIADLEALVTPRRLRDAALGTVYADGTTATDFIQSIEDQISAERLKL